MSAPTTSSRSGPRRAGAWGLAFVILLLIGAGMASVPGGHDSVADVRRYYDEHASVVLAAQVVELIATLPLVLFILGLAESALVRSRRTTMLAGGAVVLASLLTLAPPLLLVLLHGRASSGWVHALAVLSDLTDVLLFATIAGFAGTCGWAGNGRAWLRWLALLVGAAAGVRAVAILLGSDFLTVLAPVSFIVMIVAFSVLLLRRPAAEDAVRAPG